MSVVKNILLTKIEVSEKKQNVLMLCAIYGRENQLLLKIKKFQVISSK